MRALFVPVVIAKGIMPTLDASPDFLVCALASNTGLWGLNLLIKRRLSVFQGLRNCHYQVDSVKLTPPGGRGGVEKLMCGEKSYERESMINRQ